MLVLAMTVSAGYLAVQRWAPLLGRRAFPVMMAAAANVLVLGLLAAGRERPAVFAVAPQPAFVLQALAVVLWGAVLVGDVVVAGRPSSSCRIKC